MSLLHDLRRATDDLDSDGGSKFGSKAEMTIILGNGERLEVERTLFEKLLSSKSGAEVLISALHGDESLEVGDIKIDDEVWVIIEEAFVVIDEV